MNRSFDALVHQRQQAKKKKLVCGLALALSDIGALLLGRAVIADATLKGVQIKFTSCIR